MCFFLAQMQDCLASTSCPSTCAFFLPKFKCLDSTSCLSSDTSLPQTLSIWSSWSIFWSASIFWSPLWGNATPRWEKSCKADSLLISTCQPHKQPVTWSGSVCNLSLTGWVQHQEGGGGGGGELGAGLVQLHPGQDAHRVEQGDEGEELDQPDQHPGPRLEGRLQRLSRSVSSQSQCQLQKTLLQAISHEKDDCVISLFAKGYLFSTNMHRRELWPFLDQRRISASQA